MFNAIRSVTLCVGVLLYAEAFCAWDTVVFRDDFDGPAGMPDPSRWVVNHPESWWWVQGRTFFPSPVYHPDAPFPRVESGQCIIEHHLYNPYHLGEPKTTFLGGEIHSVMPFDTTRAYRFEARVKGNPYPNGLVTSFFTYGYDGFNSDEIDLEFLSNKTNDDVNYPDGDPVLTNTWNESHQLPEYVAPEGLDLTDWNTFRIYWYPDPRRVEWTWLDPNDNDNAVWLRTETNAFYIPDELMSVYFNFWAPTGDWQDAYDSNLQPVADPSQNEIYRYEIDYVEVRVPDPATLAWQGGSGSWASANWHDGSTPDNLPQTGAHMIVDAATGDSDVTVDADFDSALSVTLGQDFTASLSVDTDVTLSLDNDVTVGPLGMLSVTGSGRVEAGGLITIQGGLSGSGTISADVVMMPGGFLSPGSPDAPPPGLSGAVPPPGLGDPGITAVPEPETLVLLSMGALALLACSWRKRRRR